MKTDRERAEELARELAKGPYSPILDEKLFYTHLNSIADTLTPLLEEIDAARKMRDAINKFGSEPIHAPFELYDAVRKRNEGLNE